MDVKLLLEFKANPIHNVLDAFVAASSTSPSPSQSLIHYPGLSWFFDLPRVKIGYASSIDNKIHSKLSLLMRVFFCVFSLIADTISWKDKLFCMLMVNHLPPVKVAMSSK